MGGQMLLYSEYSTAESFLKDSHVTRTRRGHQITASSLYLSAHTLTRRASVVWKTNKT